MGRILAVVFGLGLMGFLAYRAMYGGAESAAAASGPSEPKQRLENVQKAANRIEKADQQRLDDVEAKTKE